MPYLSLQFSCDDLVHASHFLVSKSIKVGQQRSSKTCYKRNLNLANKPLVRNRKI